MLKLKLHYSGHRMHWKKPWCWERLKAGGEGDDRGWDGWLASPTQWTWAWASSGKWWWTGRPGVLQSMRSQRVRRLSEWTDDDEDNGDKKWWSWDLNPGLQTEDPGRLESMRPQRVGHDLVTKQLYDLRLLRWQLVVKNPPAHAGDIEIWIWSLGQGDPLEEGMATHSSILAWESPWTEEPGGL